MHPTKRSILIGVLAAGTVLGYGAGLFSTAFHARHRRAAFERHVAATCVDAALRARGAAAHARGGEGVPPP